MSAPEHDLVTDFNEDYFIKMSNLERTHPWTRAMRGLTLDLLPRKEFARVLDAGCGTGMFLQQWTQHCRIGEAIGVDFSAVALNLARDSVKALWTVASVSDLPFAPETFDAIHCADVLQHLTFRETDRTLEEFAALLRPAGLLALRVGADRTLRKRPQVDYSHSFSESSLRSQLKGAGLEVLFLSRVNALPSLWAELAERGMGKEPVKGIVRRPTASSRSLLLSAYLSVERVLVRNLRFPLPVGHTILCIARKS